MPRQMPPSMSPQSIPPHSDELLATTQSPNTTRTRRTNKRPITSDDNDVSEAAEATLEEEYSAIMQKAENFNKRFKHTHVLKLELHTRSIDPIPTDITITQSASSGAGGVGDSGHPIDGPVQACKEQREHHQAPRPSLSSLSSSLESQIPTIFSPGERPSDSQSVYSQITAQSTRTTYKPAGKSCAECVKHLTIGYFSEWKGHYWPIHFPQEGFYCLLCKLVLAEDKKQGAVFWQCKKCRVIFPNDLKAVEHFTDRSLPCYERHGMWLRTKPWKDHLRSHILDIGNGLKMCYACQETIPIATTNKRHECPKLKEWKYKILTPICPTCEDHPGVFLTTVEEVNNHYELEHFKRTPPRSRRSRTNAGSTIGDHDSRHDTYSLDEIDPDLIDQHDHGYAMTTHATHADSEALCSQQSQGDRQHCNAAKNASVDLREMGQISTLQDLHYPQGDIKVGDETGPTSNKPDDLVVQGGISSVREPPPLLANVVTEDGKARFLKRQSTSF